MAKYRYKTRSFLGRVFSYTFSATNDAAAQLKVQQERDRVNRGLWSLLPTRFFGLTRIDQEEVSTQISD